MSQRTNASTTLGVQLYFWARVAYLPIYVVGIPYLRTLVWTVSMIGIVMLIGGLVQGT